ncbi:MAG TPA: TetR/AcrR family transcriptional regulator [Vicinamibacterales bacterium]|jgi:AcrR family transcriptional regulator|nr:TetR/AcrR family transcriptional regulator [Vicinamibacterales bacterium]
MGIKERQERDREAVRRSILDAARDLFVTEGYQHVSIRKIAERIEYSPAALYSYFPSKDDIFFALAEEGFNKLYDSAAVDALDGLPPLECVRRIFWGLYRFSVDHPEYFALMFVDRTVPRVSREYERFVYAKQMKHTLIAHVQRAIDEGALPKHVPPTVAFRMLTTGLLGVAVLRMSDRLAPQENADDLAKDVLNITIAGLQAGVTLNSTHAPCSPDEE